MNVVLTDKLAEGQIPENWMTNRQAEYGLVRHVEEDVPMKSMAKCSHVCVLLLYF